MMGAVVARAGDADLCLLACADYDKARTPVRVYPDDLHSGGYALVEAQGRQERYALTAMQDTIGECFDRAFAATTPRREHVLRWLDELAQNGLTPA
jgi:hypothetical protein